MTTITDAQAAEALAALIGIRIIPGDFDFSFANSLVRQFRAKGSLSSNQWPHVHKLVARHTPKPVSEAPVQAADPEYPRLAVAFLTAAEGKQFPKLLFRTAEGFDFALTRCGNGSRTPGYINVTDGRAFGDNIFFGRIRPDGVSELRDNATADILETLAAYNADPRAESKVQGLRTKRCMCCGANLTCPISKAMGIGPVCADRWGIGRISLAEAREINAAEEAAVAKLVEGALALLDAN